jgi:molybdate transport system substrate-binding protein
MQTKWIVRCFFSLMACFMLAAMSGPAQSAEPLMVFAAASTTNAVTDIGNLFARKQQGRIVTSFASSSTLAKQIENGAPANVFISANPQWMDYLEKHKRIDAGTRFNLLGNHIVLIAPAGHREQVVIARGFALCAMLKGGELAMGDPAHVPAGIYGKQALEKLGVWQSVQNHVARTKDVRAALALVERGEAPLGVVYATDAAITKRVKVVGVFPDDSHPSIMYPAALVTGNETLAARRFLTFLKTPAAEAVFKKYGFTVLK